MIDQLVSFNDKTALVYESHTYSYKALYAKINELLSNQLLGIQKGEVVAILGDYSFISIALFLALSKNKNIIVPITSTIQQEIDERISEAYCDKLICINNDEFALKHKVTERKHKIILDLQEKQQSGLVLFSSGSTGKPKAMIHNLDNLMAQYQGKKEKNLNMILFLMFDHIGGLNTLLNAIAMGAAMLIPESRNTDDVCALIEKFKVRVLPSSPTFLNLILMSQCQKKYDLSSLRMITYGTETMPQSLLDRLQRAFPKVKFLQTFGTSETGIANTLSKSSNSTFMKIDDANLEYKIANNELYLKSKTQIVGYLNSSMENFTEDGWFKTGDLVEINKDGYIKVIGRNKEMINIGGEKVLPSEIESVILQLPEIEDVLVYGQANAITGQMVVCDIVTSIQPVDAKKLIRKHCREKLDNYKVPTKVNLVEKTNFGERFKKMRLK